MADPFFDIRDEAFQRLLEADKESHNSELESFDLHAEKIKAQLHASYDQYLNHLQHGYEVIINRIGQRLNDANAKKMQRNKEQFKV